MPEWEAVPLFLEGLAAPRWIDLLSEDEESMKKIAAEIGMLQQVYSFLAAEPEEVTND